MLSSYEGGEGAGKSTHVQLLSNHLNNGGTPPVVTREPGGTPGGEQIRSLIMQGDDYKFSSDTELLLFYAARSHHIQEVIKPGLKDGKIVICDRYMDSTVAYQCFGRGIDLAKIDRLHQDFVDIEPDITFLLDCDPDFGLKRKFADSKDQDLFFEQLGRDFHKKVRQGFLSQAQKYPERIHVIDATASQIEIHQKIIETVQNNA